MKKNFEKEIREVNFSGPASGFAAHNFAKENEWDLETIGKNEYRVTAPEGVKGLPRIGYVSQAVKIGGVGPCLISPCEEYKTKGSLAVRDTRKTTFPMRG